MLECQCQRHGLALDIPFLLMLGIKNASWHSMSVLCPMPSAHTLYLCILLIFSSGFCQLSLKKSGELPARFYRKKCLLSSLCNAGRRQSIQEDRDHRKLLTLSEWAEVFLLFIFFFVKYYILRAHV